LIHNPDGKSFNVSISSLHWTCQAFCPTILIIMLK